MNAPRSASASTTSTWSGSPNTRSGRRPQRLDRLADLLALVQARQGAHPDLVVAGVADGDLARRCGDGLDDGVRDRLRHDHPADGGALLARLDGHLGHDALDEEVELRVVGRHVGSEDRAVERVGLHAEPHATVQDGGVLAQRRAGGGRARERDRVLRAQLLEQPGGTAAQQLQGPLGQDARVDDAAYDRLGQVGGLARGLDDARHPGEERGGELLQEAPDREVERVDLHRDPGSGRVQVLPDEGAAPAELLARAVQHDGVVGELAGALGGEGEDRADAAVDVDHRVDAGWHRSAWTARRRRPCAR